MLARQHYRKTHQIKRDDWVLNAHGGWHIATDLTLTLAGLRRRTDGAEIRLLGAGAALALALNDAALSRRLPRIYLADFVYELGLFGLWLLPPTRQNRPAVK
jgi:hypothetical protein